VPQGIAYSSIAGVPPPYSLYAALGSLVGYALFSASGHVTGPSAAIAAVSASVVTLWAT
jgi:MFS superfamily sulfate permease-like transporter